MKSFTKLAAVFLSGGRKGRYKHYHIDSDWLVANLGAKTRPMAWRNGDRVYVANPHARTGRAFDILVSIAGVKRSCIRTCLVGRNLLAHLYELDKAGALPVPSSRQDALINAAMVDLVQKIGGFMTAKNDYTLALLDLACGTPMREPLLAAWRQRGWTFAVPKQLLREVQEFMAHSIENEWLRFNPSWGNSEASLELWGVEALSRLGEAHYAVQLRRRLWREVGAGIGYVTLYVRAHDDTLVRLRFCDAHLPKLFDAEAVVNLQRKAAPVAQAALMDALYQRNWKAGVFRKLACLMDDILVNRVYPASGAVADTEEFGVMLKERFGFTLPEKALEGVYNVVRLLAKMESAKKEVGDA